MFSVKDLIIALVISISVTVVQLPIFWFGPFSAIENIIDQIVYHFFFYSEVAVSVPWHLLFAKSPIAIVSILLSLVWIVTRQVSDELKLMFVGWYAILLVLVGLTLFSSIKSIRYFYPILQWWEILLPVLILYPLEKSVKNGKQMKILKGSRFGVLSVALYLVLTASNFAMIINTRYISELQVVCIPHQTESGTSVVCDSS